MKKLIFILAFILIAPSYSCNKNIPNIKIGVVIAPLCYSIQTVVQLNYHDPLSYNWTDANGKTYQNVIVAYNKNLQNSAGKSFTFSQVRLANNTDPNIAIPADCIFYPILFIDNVKLIN